MLYSGVTQPFEETFTVGGRIGQIPLILPQQVALAFGMMRYFVERPQMSSCKTIAILDCPGMGKTGSALSIVGAMHLWMQRALQDEPSPFMLSGERLTEPTT